MALAGAIIIGPRLGRYLPDGSVKPMPAHSFPLAALGVLILWLGWFGFNGGSELAMDAEVGRIVLVTNLAAAAGFCGALTWIRIRSGLLDLSMALNGALAGLVGITAGCYNITGGWSLVVGILAGVLCVEGVLFIDKLKIDDPVGAISVHGVVGLLGLLLVPLTNPLTEDGGASFLGQLLGAATIFIWVFVASGIVWFALKAIMGIRVTEEEEYEGVDLAECGMEAYPEFTKAEI